jgi:hypothetical protein
LFIVVYLEDLFFQYHQTTYYKRPNELEEDLLKYIRRLVNMIGIMFVPVKKDIFYNNLKLRHFLENHKINIDYIYWKMFFI